VVVVIGDGDLSDETARALEASDARVIRLPNAPTADVPAPEAAERLDLDDAELRVLAGIVEPTLPDRLASSLGMGIHEVVGVLMRLELRGFVRNVGGRYESTLKARPQRDAASERSARGTPDRATSRTGTSAPSSRLAAIDER
jgi:hypothetical protein